MARFESFARDLKLATAGIAPAALNLELARFARAELAAVIASGEGSPRYTKYVNGREGADESSVQVPGPIVYDFIWWTEVIEFGLEQLRKRSPVRSGRYQESWFVWSNGARITDYSRLPIDADVLLINDQPYARKIDVGFMKMSVPPGIVELVRKDVMAIYGNMLTAKRTLIPLPWGYTLRGRFSRGIRPHSRTKLKRDTAAGAKMTYPALLLQMRA